MRYFPACLLAVLAASLAAPFAPSTASAEEAKRPNILLIVSDDQSPYDFGFYNPRSTLETPTLDRLASEGMVLDQAYHMGAWCGDVCTASRHMIMLGRTVWHIPDKRKPGRSFYEDDPQRVPPGLAQNSLPAVFNRAGYETMRTCKVGNSYDGANELFTIRHDKSSRGGTEEQGGDGTGSDWHAERVLDYLNDRDRQPADARKPFLIYLGFSHPHDPRFGEPDYLAKYGATNHQDPDNPPAPGASAPALPANYLPAHPFPHGHPKLRDEEQVDGVWKRRDPATIRNELGREYACAEFLDHQIGRVLARLEAMGELENTYVIFTSDHGIAIGRHGLTGKQNLYEHTWRVPYIVVGPGIKPGRAPGNTYLLDTLATLCDLAGVEAPATNEGLSMRPVLEGEQQQLRDTLYGVYCCGTKPGIQSVRHGDWKLIQYDTLDGAVHQTQLFNLAENPLELIDGHHAPGVASATGNRPSTQQRNLADDPRYAAKRQEMAGRLLEQMRRHEDPYRLWDQPADPEEADPEAAGDE